MDEFANALIHGRLHFSPKRLGAPGPSSDQKKEILIAASAAPDHGQLMPWRFVEISDTKRAALGEVFKSCLSDRDPHASSLQLQTAYEKAFHGPLLLAAITRFEQSENTITREEKLISTGCAIQNILLTTHALGFGSGLSSGKAIGNPRMKLFFNLKNDEELICFITIGTVLKNKPGRLRPGLSSYFSVF